MKTHQVKRNTKRVRTTRVGRGGTRGKTSGRGHKGQNSRAGTHGRPEVRDQIKKLPKLRGRSTHANKPKMSYATVTLSDLESGFKTGDRVTPQSLLDAGLVRKNRGVLPKIKVLATGELKKKLTVKSVATTKASKEAIEKAGGEVK
jgi:large subunit ribosomal protein L15